MGIEDEEYKKYTEALNWLVSDLVAKQKQFDKDMLEIRCWLAQIDGKLNDLLKKDSPRDRQDKEKKTIETLPNIKSKEAHSTKCKCEYCKTHPEFAKRMEEFLEFSNYKENIFEGAKPGELR